MVDTESTVVMAYVTESNFVLCFCVISVVCVSYHSAPVSRPSFGVYDGTCRGVSIHCAHFMLLDLLKQYGLTHTRIFVVFASFVGSTLNFFVFGSISTCLNHTPVFHCLVWTLVLMVKISRLILAATWSLNLLFYYRYGHCLVINTKCMPSYKSSYKSSQISSYGNPCRLPTCTQRLLQQIFVACSSLNAS